MGIQVEDGTGTGKQAKVDENFRLHTESVARSSLSVASEAGIAIGFSTPFYTLTSNGGRMLWIKNLSNRLLYLTKFWFNWNGGNTNHNRTMYGMMYFNDGTPSAHHTASGAGALNTNAQNPSSTDLSVYAWDTTGDGMTVVDGTPAMMFLVRQGSNAYEVDSAIIIGKDASVGFNAVGEEIGVMSINIIGHLGAP